jgi:hypothetical protein
MEQTLEGQLWQSEFDNGFEVVNMDSPATSLRALPSVGMQQLSGSEHHSVLLRRCCISTTESTVEFAALDSKEAA